MKPETATTLMLVIITLLLLWNGTMLLKMIVMLKPPRFLVPDLKEEDLKLTPGPVIRHEIVRTYERGDRVRVNHRSGFNRGAVGVVEFQEPSGQCCWVTRDGAESPCYFHNFELDPENP